jgi:uncharacterized protein (TIGR03084 family)
MPAPSMADLADDLAAETAELRALVAELDDVGWATPTPAAGWAVRDQVGHLAHYDAVAVRAAVDPDRFRAELVAAEAEGGADPDQVAARYRGLPPAALLSWFDSARAELLAVFRGLDPRLRVPWFSAPMTAASALTARIMETWAHGQDVVDALGAVREPTARLRHVAHLGVLTRPFSFAVHGRDVPDAPVRVELAAPDGGTWTWGPAGAPDRVTGPAPDFCLVVTQRRHPADTAVTATGVVAAAWLQVAQAFAGPPGSGRAPGRAGRPPS